MDITVIIPSYKPDEYIKDCLKSLGEQTLNVSRFEIIIVLNGCNEPWFSQIRIFIEKYLLQNNVYVIQTDTPGVSNARNIAINRAKGKYIAFIDDDDIVSPAYLESLIKSVDCSPNDTIACSDVRTFDSENNIDTDYISRAYTKAVNYPDKNDILDRRSFLSSSCCKLIPRSIIGYRRFNTDIAVGEDALFMATISDKINNIIPASSDAIYYRRIRPGSVTRNKKPIAHTLQRKKSLVWNYVKLLVSGFPRYNLLFIITRLIAVVKG